MTDEQADATVAAAWDTGIRYFDTAPHYGLGLSERRLGDALRGRPRDEFVVSTKVGRLIDDGFTSRSDRDALFDVTTTTRRRWDFSSAGVLRSLSDSIARLDIDRIDIALVHDPDDHLEQAVEESIPTLCRLRGEGVIRSVGVGVNRSDVAVHLLTRTDLDVVLIAGRVTLLDQSAAAELLPLCLERGVRVIAAGLFNSGLLATDTAAADATFDYAMVPAAVAERVASIATVCAAHEIGLPEAALWFALEHPAIESVLISGRSPHEVAENSLRLARAAARDPDVWVGVWADLRERGLIDDAVTA